MSHIKGPQGPQRWRCSPKSNNPLQYDRNNITKTLVNAKATKGPHISVKDPNVGDKVTEVLGPLSY